MLPSQNTPTASLQRGRTTPYECPKQSDCEVSIIVGLWECGVLHIPKAPLLLPLLHCHCFQVHSDPVW